MTKTTPWQARTVAVACAASVASLGCQVVADFESFAADAGAADVAKPHPCEVLPRIKPDPAGLVTMVLVKHPSGACSWIDRTEVSVEQYAKWVAAEKTPAFDKDHCAAWKVERSNPLAADDACTASIDRAQDPVMFEQKPVRCVDWCDARAFCAWAGKRLCTTEVSVQGVVDPEGQPDEWGYACKGPGEAPYPTGMTVDVARCRLGGNCVAVGGARTCGPTTVGLLGTCESASGARDMIGNVREWVWSCSSRDRSASATCTALGGSYADAPEATACRLRPSAVARSARDALTGFRCCASLTPAELARVNE